MLANANGPPSFGGWLPDQYSSLLYSPVSDQSAIFDTVVGQQKNQQQQQQQQQQQLQEMIVQHTKNECSANLALSCSFLSDNANVDGIGPLCSSHGQPSLVPSSNPSFHPTPPSSSSSYVTTIAAAAYQTQYQNELANFVLQTAATAAGVGPTMAPVMGGSTAQNPGADRPRVTIKKKPKPVPEEKKDQAYRERRLKNNDSARRSREQRRRKEQETQLRNAELEKENAQLRRDLHCVLVELHQLRMFVGVPKPKQIA